MVCEKCNNDERPIEERVTVVDVNALPDDEFIVATKQHPSIAHKQAQFHEERVPMILLDKNSRNAVGAVTGGIVTVTNKENNNVHTAMVQIQMREFIGRKVATLNYNLMENLGIPYGESGQEMWGPYVVKIAGGDANAESQFLAQYEAEVRQMIAEAQRATSQTAGGPGAMVIDLTPIIEEMNRGGGR